MVNVKTVFGLKRIEIMSLKKKKQYCVSQIFSQIRREINLLLRRNTLFWIKLITDVFQNQRKNFHSCNSATLPNSELILANIEEINKTVSLLSRYSVF